MNISESEEKLKIVKFCVQNEWRDVHKFHDESRLVEYRPLEVATS